MATTMATQRPKVPRSTVGSTPAGPPRPRTSGAGHAANHWAITSRNRCATARDTVEQGSVDGVKRRLVLGGQRQMSATRGCIFVDVPRQLRDALEEYGLSTA